MVTSWPQQSLFTATKLFPHSAHFLWWGPLWLPTRDWKQWPGAQAGGIELLITSSISPREETHPTLIQTSEDILILPSVCTSKWSAPQWTEGSSGSHPYRHQQRWIWRLLLCPPLAYGMSSFYLSAVRDWASHYPQHSWVICCNTPKFLSVFHIKIVITIITNDVESKAWTNATKKLSLEPFQDKMHFSTVQIHNCCPD